MSFYKYAEALFWKLAEGKLVASTEGTKPTGLFASGKGKLKWKSKAKPFYRSITVRDEKEGGFRTKWNPKWTQKQEMGQ